MSGRPAGTGVTKGPGHGPWSGPGDWRQPPPGSADPPFAQRGARKLWPGPAAGDRASNGHGVHRAAAGGMEALETIETPVVSA